MLKIPEDLAKSLRSGNVRLFVGSGVSAAAGMLGWNDLIRRMQATIKKENRTYGSSELKRFLATADYLDIAEVFKQTVRDHRSARFLLVPDWEREVGLGSSNVLQPVALTGDLSIHGVGCQIDLTGPRNRTVINEHLTEELLIP